MGPRSGSIPKSWHADRIAAAMVSRALVRPSPAWPESLTRVAPRTLPRRSSRATSVLESPPSTARTAALTGRVRSFTGRDLRGAGVGARTVAAIDRQPPREQLDGNDCRGSRQSTVDLPQGDGLGALDLVPIAGDQQHGRTRSDELAGETRVELTRHRLDRDHDDRRLLTGQLQWPVTELSGLHRFGREARRFLERERPHLRSGPSRAAGQQGQDGAVAQPATERPGALRDGAEAPLERVRSALRLILGPPDGVCGR